MDKIKEETTTPGKIWKTSITKSELSQLPAESYHGNIIVIDRAEAAVEACEILRREKILGFDTETRPTFKSGQHHNVALLQLSTHTECFLFRINIIGMPKCVLDILEDEHILKIGVSIHDDFLNLHKCYRLEPKGFIDLQAYVKSYNIADNSLSRIYGILFDKRISKGQRLSNWETQVLTQYQQEYAALDALACITIYEYLNKDGFDYRTSKYYREFDDPNYQQTQQEKTT